jgi:hypothetical protein
MKKILEKFTISTGLKINFHKSSMVPINTKQQKVQELADEFGCKVESLPFTYLGLPMGTTRPRVNDLTPMIWKVDKRLSGLSNIMSYSARLVIIKVVIAAMPNNAMCAMKVHFTHIDHVEKESRTFLWQGKDIHKSGKCLISWDKVCKPKEVGGLGVLEMREQNKALQNEKSI